MFFFNQKNIAQKTGSFFVSIDEKLFLTYWNYRKNAQKSTQKRGINKKIFVHFFLLLFWLRHGKIRVSVEADG